MPKIMKSMNTISRCQAIYRAGKLQGKEIAPCHWAFVLTVCRAPGLSQEEIAGELCINKSTVTRAISVLEENGLVERKNDSSDKRILLVYPTEKLLEVLPRVKEITRKWNELIAEGISDEEMAVFLSVLSRMEKSAKRIVSCGREGNLNE